MNTVLTQLPRAQEAYTQTVANWHDVDTTELLLACDKAIKEGIVAGRLCCGIAGITDMRQAEKLAIELAELGYNTNAVNHEVRRKEDGTLQQTFAVNINWSFCPPNRRDAYTV